MKSIISIFLTIFCLNFNAYNQVLVYNTGSKTIDKASGIVDFATGATSLTVTNSLVSEEKQKQCIYKQETPFLEPIKILRGDATKKTVYISQDGKVWGLSKKFVGKWIIIQNKPYKIVDFDKACLLDNHPGLQGETEAVFGTNYAELLNGKKNLKVSGELLVIVSYPIEMPLNIHGPAKLYCYRQNNCNSVFQIKGTYNSDYSAQIICDSVDFIGTMYEGPTNADKFCAIFWDSGQGDFLLKSCSFRGFTTALETTGDCIENCTGQRLIIANRCEFERNFVAIGAFGRAVELWAEDCRFVQNGKKESAGEYGHAIYAHRSTSCYISGCTFIKNITYNIVFFSSGDWPERCNGQIVYNSTFDGGILGTDNKTNMVYVNLCKFTNGASLSISGGCNVNNCSFTNNSYIYTNCCTSGTEPLNFNIKNCRFEQNNSYCINIANTANQKSFATVENCTFLGSLNDIIIVQSGTLNISNCVFSGTCKKMILSEGVLFASYIYAKNMSADDRHIKLVSGEAYLNAVYSGKLKIYSGVKGFIMKPYDIAEVENESVIFTVY